jgi:hypothetical protein
VALAALSAVVSLWLTGEKTSATPVVDTVAE